MISVCISRKESARIYKSKHTSYYKYQDRSNQIPYRSVGIFRNAFCLVHHFMCRVREYIALFGILFVLLHRSVLKFHRNKRKHHYNCKQSVKVIRYRPYKQFKSAYLVFRYKSGNSRRPRRNRSNNADRSRSSIYEIRKL